MHQVLYVLLHLFSWMTLCENKIMAYFNLLVYFMPDRVLAIFPTDKCYHENLCNWQRQRSRLISNAVISHHITKLLTTRSHQKSCFSIRYCTSYLKKRKRNIQRKPEFPRPLQNCLRVTTCPNDEINTPNYKFVDV